MFLDRSQTPSPLKRASIHRWHRLGWWALVLFLGCKPKNDDPLLLKENVTPRDGTTIPPCTSTGCVCTQEKVRAACGRVEYKTKEYVLCGMGERVCTGGQWSECIINNTSTMATSSIRATEHILALAEASICTNNPCDPYCRQFADTPDGLGDGGIVASEGGLTLPEQPDAGMGGRNGSPLYEDSWFVRDYNTTTVCAPGTAVRWGLWSWVSQTPGDSRIEFFIHVAATQENLDLRLRDPLLFSSPPNSARLAGQHAIAQAGIPNTEAGAALVDYTLQILNKIRALPYLRLYAHLVPSSDGSQAPLLQAWNLQISCVPSE